MKVIVTAGARPNFVKAAPLYHVLSAVEDVEVLFVHSGQHTYYELSKQLLDQFEMPEPDYFLQSDNSSAVALIASILTDFAAVLEKEKPDLVVVFGDVNSTLAFAIAAQKMGVKVAHVEAGLRSRDRLMPEEINRLATDQICDYLFVSESSGMENLERENVTNEGVFYVGNIMMDTLAKYQDKAKELAKYTDFGLEKGKYALFTCHRPENVDFEMPLKQMVKLIRLVASKVPVILPIHHRTKRHLEQFGLWEAFSKIPNLHLIASQGYLEFASLMQGAAVVVTDSGGVQEETTFLDIPCFTVRKNTERPATITEGTNELLAVANVQANFEVIAQTIDGKTRKGNKPKYWDGQTAQRILEIIRTLNL